MTANSINNVKGQSALDKSDDSDMEDAAGKDRVDTFMSLDNDADDGIPAIMQFMLTTKKLL